MKYTLIRSRRKTLSIQVLPNSEIVVRSPQKLSLEYIEKYIFAKKSWIEKHQEKFLQNPPKKYSPEEILVMKGKLEKYLFPKVAEIWQKNQFLPKYQSIKITKSERRWGSCSTKNFLCFSYRLADFIEKNPDFIDAVIVHELAHLQEKNHKQPFWNLVFLLMPDYRQKIKNI